MVVFSVIEFLTFHMELKTKNPSLLNNWVLLLYQFSILQVSDKSNFGFCILKGSYTNPGIECHRL